jgi:SAM-dependent methyltransferase
VFVESGADAARSIREVFEAARRPDSSYPRWLDFGCGCGRVARHLARFPFVAELSGVDVDGEAIRWAASHLPGRYAEIPSDPPTALSGGSHDVVYAGSVFTHLDERRQDAWLAELHRVLRPGGLLIASTHGPSLIWARPDVGDEGREQLSGRGFLFAPGGSSSFNDDGTFHSREYLLAHWGKHFGLLHFRESGLDGYQDLAVWQKW